MTARIFAIAILIVIVLGGNPLLATDIDNCCFVNRQCVTDQEWVEGYHAYQRNECSGGQPAAAVSAPISAPAGGPVDNCCQVNWQCDLIGAWVEGYHAFQRNECHVVSPPPVIIRPTPAAASPAGQPIDNCCFVNRQCATEQDWVDGYEAFKYDNMCRASPPVFVPGPPVNAATFDCNAISRVGPVGIAGPVGSHPIPIHGPEDFTRKMRAALDLLKRKAGGWRWYDYTVSGISSIHAREGGRVSINSPTGKVSWGTGHGYLWIADLARIASILVHEACHVHSTGRSKLSEEIECTVNEISALDAICPNHYSRASQQNLVDNLRSDPSLRWWGHD